MHNKTILFLFGFRKKNRLYFSKYGHEMLLTAKIIMKRFEIGITCFQLTEHIVYCSRLTALTTVDVLRRQAKGAAPHIPMTSI